MIDYYPTLKFTSLDDSYSHRNADYQRHGLFEMLWFTNQEQEGFQYIDLQEYPIKSQSVVLLAKSQVHQFDAGYKGHSVTLPPSFFQIGENKRFRIMFNPFLNDPIMLDSELIVHLEAIFKMIEMENSTTADQHVVNSYFSLFLYKLTFASRANVTRDKNLPRLQKLMELMEANYVKERNVAFYADSIGITPKRLNQILKERTTLTVTQLVHRMLVTEAKRLIARRDQNMKQIAFQLGFSEQPYFNRFFKKLTGMTPEQFQSTVKKIG